MKQDIITISLLMITCLILPIFLLPVINYIERSRLLRVFNREATKFKLNLEQKEFWNLTIIGIDPVQKKLLFVQKRNDSFSIELVDLIDIKEIKLIPVSVRSRKYRKNGSVLKRIDLQLISLSPQGSKLLNIYDSRLNRYRDEEFSHAEKWNSLIQKYLPTDPFFQRIA